MNIIMYGGASNAGNMWTGCTSNAAPVAPYLNVMEEIHVLLVENDPKCLFETAKMLQMCAYKVTIVDVASSAITMLTNQNTKADVVMTSTYSPDGQGFKLLQIAVSMSIPVVLLSVDEDPFFTSKAIQDGAFLNIQKPVPMEILKFLWQLIMRQKMQKIVTQDQREINAPAMNNNVNNVELTNHIMGGEMEPFRGGGSMNNNVLAVYNNNNNGRQIEEVYYGDENHGRVVRRKSCTEWTDELHSKFVDAVLTLGDGRCFPKEIMLLMNVPGLTRMQVASHLQKCRNENWRTPEERKNQLANQSENPPLPIKARRFGSMPNVFRSSPLNVRRTNGGSSSRNPGEPAGPVQNVMGSTTEPMNLDVANNHHNVVDYGPVVPHTHHHQQNPTAPDGPAGLVQNVVVGSTEPMNLVANNNVVVNYGPVVTHSPHHQQIIPEINNNIVCYNNGAGTDDQYLANLSDDFALNFGDIDSFFNNDNFPSMQLDSPGGLFNHVPGSGNMVAAAGAYDQQDPFYHNQQNAYNNPAGNYEQQWNNGAGFGSGANAS